MKKTKGDIGNEGGLKFAKSEKAKKHQKEHHEKVAKSEKEYHKKMSDLAHKAKVGK